MHFDNPRHPNQIRTSGRDLMGPPLEERPLCPRLIIQEQGLKVIPIPMTFTPDDSSLVCSGTDGIIRMWNLDETTHIRTLKVGQIPD